MKWYGIIFTAGAKTVYGWRHNHYRLAQSTESQPITAGAYISSGWRLIYLRLAPPLQTFNIVYLNKMLK